MGQIDNTSYFCLGLAIANGLNWLGNTFSQIGVSEANVLSISEWSVTGIAIAASMYGIYLAAKHTGEETDKVVKISKIVLLALIAAWLTTLIAYGFLN